MTALCGIYVIKHIDSGRLYVGSSDNITRRWNRHKNELSKAKHPNAKLQGAWIEHGADKFEFCIVEAVATAEELRAREQHWLDTKKSVADGFNICPVAGNSKGVIPGPETRRKQALAKLGKPRSAETRAKISAYQKAKPPAPEWFRKKISAAKMGHVHSEEAKRNMSLAAKGRKMSPEQRAKIGASVKATLAAKKANGNQDTGSVCVPV